MNELFAGRAPRRAAVPLSILIFVITILFAVPAMAQKTAQPQNPLVPAPKKVSEAQPTPAPAPPAEMTSADVGAFLDGLVPLQLQRNNIAGAVVVVVKDGKVLFAKGYGHADAEKKKPVSDSDTLFRVGSISKLFTWTAVMQLQEEGKLNLDRDINDYLDFKIPEKFGNPITVRDLMTHRPGFEEQIKDLFTTDPKKMIPLGEYLKTHTPGEIFEPGTVPAYSNYGAALAGYIVQRVSGEKFEDYVARHIFQPLGMTHASFVQPLPPDLKPLMSEGYELGSGKAKPFELIPAAPAGALSVSGQDMARFIIAQLQNGEYDGQRLLQPQTVALMHSRQAGLSPALNAMALGFYEESRNGHRIIGHGGDTMWFHSDLHLVQDQNLGFFISSNSAGKGDASLRTMVWQKFLDRYDPYQPPAAKAPATKMADAKLVCGDYIPSRRLQTNFLWLGSLLGEMTVKANADGTIENGSKQFNGEPKKYEEIGPLVYRATGGQEMLAFVHGPGGRLTVAIDFPAMAFQRASWYQGKNFTLVLLIGCAAVFLLTLIFWFVGGLVRWHYGRKLEMEPGPRRLRAWTRVVCIVDLAALGTWVGTLAYGIGDITRLTPALDKWFHLAQLLTMAGVVLTLVALAEAVCAWTTSRWWWSRVWETLIALAGIAFVWLAIYGHLWSWNVKY